MKTSKKYVRTVSAALCSLLLLSSAPALADTYATVRGGGLNLRQTASLDAKVLGQYPTGTWVTIHEQGDTWSRVTVNGKSGYMMTKYLAFGEDADKVDCAFPQMEVREEYRLNVVDEATYEFIVLDEPNKSAPDTRWHSSDNWVVIGIKGNYYIVMNDNENVCYIPQKQLWDGNG